MKGLHEWVDSSWTAGLGSLADASTEEGAFPVQAEPERSPKAAPAPMAKVGEGADKGQGGGEEGNDGQVEAGDFDGDGLLTLADMLPDFLARYCPGQTGAAA